MDFGIGIKLLMSLEVKDLLGGEELISEGSVDSSILLSFMEGFNNGILFFGEENVKL